MRSVLRSISDHLLVCLSGLTAEIRAVLTSAGFKRGCKTCVGFLVMLAPLSAPAQLTCIGSWQDRLGTSLDDQIRTTVRDNAGNVYIGGFDGGMLGVENWWPVGDSKGFVEKRAPSGALLWRYDFDTAGTDIVEAMALDSNGRVIVAGRTDGAFPGAVNGGQFDLFLGILDADGHLVSVKQLGDERPQHPVALTVLQDGDLVVAGYDDVFVLGNAVIDWENGFVARFKISAANAVTPAWWLQPNLPQTDLVTSVTDALDGSGDVFVSDLNSTSPANGGGVHVKRLDQVGNTIWTKTVSSISLDYISNVAVSNDGRLFVAGTTIGQVAGPSLGNSDGFVVELDPKTGTFLHGRQLGSAGAEWIYSLSIDSSGTLYVAGETDGAIAPGFHVDGSYVPFAQALSTNLISLGAWQPDPPAIFAEETLLIVPTGCNGAVLVAGSSNVSLPGLPSAGREDALVLTIPLVDSIFLNDFEVGK